MQVGRSWNCKAIFGRNRPHIPLNLDETRSDAVQSSTRSRKLTRAKPCPLSKRIWQSRLSYLESMDAECTDEDTRNASVLRSSGDG